MHPAIRELIGRPGMAIKKGSKKKSRFGEVVQADVPLGRSGKHHALVTELLHDLNELKPGMALKVAIADLGTSKAKIRSALLRVSKATKAPLATSSDAKYLYIWKTLDGKPIKP